MTTGLSLITTGFPSLDTALGGLQPTDLVIVASRPGVWKTEFCLQLACQVAQQNQIAAYLSLHQDQQEVTQQILALYSQVPLYRIKSGDISATEKQMLSQVIDSLAQIPLWIESTQEKGMDSTLPTLHTRTKHLQEQNLPLGLVVVDYLQLIGQPDTSAPEPGEVVISTLQDWVQNLGCPVIGICQLPREVENRAIPRPTLFDLKQYDDTIDHAADVIILMHPSRQVSVPSPSASVEFIVSRRDHTKAATLTLRLDPEVHRFREPDSGSPDHQPL